MQPGPMLLQASGLRHDAGVWWVSAHMSRAHMCGVTYVCACSPSVRSISDQVPLRPMSLRGRTQAEDPSQSRGLPVPASCGPTLCPLTPITSGFNERTMLSRGRHTGPGVPGVLEEVTEDGGESRLGAQGPHSQEWLPRCLQARQRRRPLLPVERRPAD